MIALRPSVSGDLPALRELWKLSFGDGEDYLDNFFAKYYTPRRVLVLEEEGRVRAMTAWFASHLALVDGQRFSCAYLYAVATHPEHRGKGLAGALLQYCDFFLRQEAGFQAVSTVPARPDLHVFFGGNGFRPCFVHQERVCLPGQLPPAGDGALSPLEPEAYRSLREELLSGTPHIDLALEGIVYQAGVCRLSGGGLYRYSGGGGEAALCLEGAGEGVWYLKELLGPESAAEEALGLLPGLVPAAARVMVRRPGGDTPFGMLKWLWPGLEARWDWNSAAYLGPAFD